jgi:hypothetical protein
MENANDMETTFWKSYGTCRGLKPPANCHLEGLDLWPIYNGVYMGIRYTCMLCGSVSKLGTTKSDWVNHHVPSFSPLKWHPPLDKTIFSPIENHRAQSLCTCTLSRFPSSSRPWQKPGRFQRVNGGYPTGYPEKLPWGTPFWDPCGDRVRKIGKNANVGSNGCNSWFCFGTPKNGYGLSFLGFIHYSNV